MSNAVLKRRALRRRQTVRSSRVPWLMGIVIAIAGLAALGTAAGLATVWASYNHLRDGYQDPYELVNQQFIGLTQIYDRTGQVELGTLSNPNAQLSDPVPLGAISPHLVDATVSTEDNSFWDNPGFNVRGLTRAFFENIEDYLRGEDLSGTGGSSITQQLVKLVYLSTDCVVVNGIQSCTAPRTVERKLKEIAYAVELEQDLTKEEILTLYLNQISYADRYVGVQAASQGYFHKDAIDLTIGEAALLAGIPQAPTAYHPRLNCSTNEEGSCRLDEEGRYLVSGAARERQHEVLDLMERNGYITAEEAQAARDDVVRVYPGTTDVEAPAWIDNQVEPTLVRMCEAGLLPKLESVPDCATSVASSGFSVTTSLDWSLTQQALTIMQQQIAAGLENGCNCHNASIVTIDPRSGQMLVYVPNVDPDNDSELVRGDIDQANEINQPGSSFKPAVYLTWFDVLNKAPLSTFWDTSPLPIEGTEIVNPRGGSGSEGLITARAGLGGSQNVPAFRAAYESGIDNVIAMAGRVGITTLYQQFDPTWVAHEDVSYGASIATGGANIKVVDMAYMETVFANMGVMVGVPHHAETLDMSTLISSWNATGRDWDRAQEQKLDFSRGYTRLPGTRELDPVVILEVRDSEGNIVFKHAETEDEAEDLREQGILTEALQRRQVVDAGSAWLLYSIMSDCEARFIIWGCGTSNTDVRLDFFVSDETNAPVPAGVKTGTQQGPLSAADTLETWVTGYSRYSGTAVWVGNANNQLVVDGPAGNYAAANATLYLYKAWQGAYHASLRARGEFDVPAGFEDLQPDNVAFGPFRTPTTARGRGGGCTQTVDGWYRTDVEYASECEFVAIDSRNGLLAGASTPGIYRIERGVVILPELARSEAIALARSRGIPIAPSEVSSGQVPAAIYSPGSGAIIAEPTSVFGSAETNGLQTWTLLIGRGGSPSEWTPLAGGSSPAGGALGTIDPGNFPPGVYTVSLVVEDSILGTVSDSIVINIGVPGAEDDDDDNGDDDENGDNGDDDGGENGDGGDGDGEGDDPDSGDGTPEANQVSVPNATPTPKIPPTPIPTPTPVAGRPAGRTFN